MAPPWVNGFVRNRRLSGRREMDNAASDPSCPPRPPRRVIIGTHHFLGTVES